MTVGHGALFPPCDATGWEKPMPQPLRQAVVTGVGIWRGEGMALVEVV
jgi:3-oxoacyl-[acyl-carrier-protein] synthase II